VYYLGAVLTIVLTMGLANLLRSRVGRAWIAIRDNDIAAETMGINIVSYKLMAYFVAGFIGGVAGAFWVSNTAALSPENFQWFWSLWLVGVILIGGVGSIYGTIFGSLFMVLVMEGLKFAIVPLTPIYPAIGMKMLSLKDAVFGLSIVIFLMYEPNGLAYRWWQIKNYFNLWPFSY
jgi:branched-chain amino acid transport system permease protein